MKIRDRIYQIIEPAMDGDRYSKLYDLSMMVIIVASFLVPLAFKQETMLLTTIDYTCVTIFIVDYALHLLPGFSNFRHSNHSAPCGYNHDRLLWKKSIKRNR